MTSLTSRRATDPRCFNHFLDPVDMIGCFPAEASMAEINQLAAEHDLYFPLACDPVRSVREHVASLEYAPESTRFGPYVDNVPGMNWKLPGGQLVRIGEQVVKSTTGYDLLRFLLHSGERYGSAQDYVLRLRPLSHERYAGIFTGTPECLQALVEAIVCSSWSHWINCLNWVVSAEDAPFLECYGACLTGEGGHFIDYFSGLAKEHHTSFEPIAENPICPLPAFTIKTTPSQALTLASQCKEALGGHARILSALGVVLMYPEIPINDKQLRELHSRTTMVGGHLFGTAIQPYESSPKETPWIESILNDWRQL